MPGIDGRVGMFGLSYSAHTQVAVASTGAPAMQALVADSVGFQTGVSQGGAFKLK